MSGNKMTTKTKGKDDKVKTSKYQICDENEDLDFSLLRKPILTSITGFAQARKIFDFATEELKGLISNECDLLYECKVCRNIFRSLVNFISHKRVYCKEEFNLTSHGQFFKMSSTANEMLKITNLEQTYFEFLKNKDEIQTINTDEIDNRIPLTKDLSAVIEKITVSKGVQDTCEDPKLVLQKIPNSSVAVFQNFDSTDEKLDRMRNQVKELDNILSQNKAILQNDGKFKIQSSLPCDSDNVIQISDDDDNDATTNLKCKICDQIFSTPKTLKFHMKYKHLKSRLVYPCPDCLEIFSTSWSVYRHLFKVHRKTAAQIRRLRESIQAKAFKMNNPPAFYEKRKNIKAQAIQKISEEERLDQENQAWMDNVEGDGDVPRCFGCGRTFERRAALAAHTHTCQPRSRALAVARRPHETKKIEIQIRKDYNKGSISSFNLSVKSADSNDNKITTDVVPNTKIVNESDSKEAEKQVKEDILEEMSINVTEPNKKNNCSPDKPKETPHYSPKKPNVSHPMSKTIINLPFSQHLEKSNLSAFRQKIQPHIEVSRLLCKKCDVQYDTVQELYHHMADHYKWMRYACKLCNFKHYDFDKLPEHVKVVHKLRGDSDFYFSTVKAIDGNEALELSECSDEATETNDTSPDSRRPSGCSSDSSRPSDDNSSSSTRTEPGSRKRKLCQNKVVPKKRREILINDDDDDDQKNTDVDKDNDTSSISKTFEENSSDMDDIDDKTSKRSSIDTSMSVPLRRPVRKKTKLKNEDFEYDLSNLLKMEAQGYRESQTVTPKTNQSKKKPTQDSSSYYEIINKDCIGALTTLSTMAAELSAAHLKNVNFVLCSSQREQTLSNIFVRPLLPKNISKEEKNLLKKDLLEESIDNSSKQKEIIVENSEEQEKPKENDTEDISKTEKEIKPSSSEKSESLQKEQDMSQANTVKQSINIPAVVPLKFRRHSLEVIKKNPVINKNITDFKKAGMKTKILVIKPINRNKDSTTGPNTPLKFQTIKLKDPSKGSSSKEESVSDQVVLVKVPKVDCMPQRAIPDSNITSQITNKTNTTTNISKTVAIINSNSNTLNNNVSDDDDIKKDIDDINDDCNVSLKTVSRKNNEVTDDSVLNQNTEMIVPNEIIEKNKIKIHLE